MKHLVILLLFAVSWNLRGSDVPGLREFAEEYWQAILSQDTERIYSFYYYPPVFESLTSDEAEFVKTSWTSNYRKLPEKAGDFHEISTQSLSSDAQMFPDSRWAAKPEYQFQIETFRRVANGKEGITVIADTVIQRAGRFYIVRPIPPEEKLKEIMKKQG